MGPQSLELSTERLPDSYVPPVVAILPHMAVGEPALRRVAKASGTSLERAFERASTPPLRFSGTRLACWDRGKVGYPMGKR
jgi:hypothetical protein